MGNKCLHCYKTISNAELTTPAGSQGYHPKCCQNFFGNTVPPSIDISQEQLLELAKDVIKSNKAVTGVQPKLSLGISSDRGTNQRLTIVGVLGEYILKPQSDYYPHLPEIEHVTMSLAQNSKLKTVEHSLITLQSGQLAYITKRIDRHNGSKLHMEDMCQLTERLTEHKYKGSYEQIAKVIKKYTANSGLNIVEFYELVLFSFLTGNNDMHLKNFSLLKQDGHYDLCPAYDLVASELVVEGDDEELALNLNGKKRKIKRNDFEIAMSRADINPKVIDNLFKKYGKLIPKWLKIINNSFLSDNLKENYTALIENKAKQLQLLK